MATRSRKTAKVSTKLFGGPFHGKSLCLTPGLGTLIFRHRDDIGYYSGAGSWKRILKHNPEIHNPQIILGYN